MRLIEDPWGWGNDVLYRMCRENPNHRDEGVVLGKIWIIGRCYAAAIERRAGNNIVSGEDFYSKQVAPQICASGIDNWIDSVRGIRGVTPENWDAVLLAHAKLTNLLWRISGQRKRSLASKYLHFHVPQAFFIYDSIANKNLRSRMKRRRFKYPLGYDDEYAGFVVRCVEYRDQTFERQIGRQTSPRQLDTHLLYGQEDGL